MPTTRAVTRKPRTRVRAVRRITWEVVLLVGRLRAFFTSERDNNAAEMLEQPVDRTAAATGLSRSTVIRIANGEYADTRPLSGKRERRVSKRRVPTSELSRVRETVYAQYADKTVPTLDSALALLQEGAGEGDDLSDYKWSRSTLHGAMTDLGFNFTRGPNHYRRTSGALERTHYFVRLLFGRRRPDELTFVSRSVRHSSGTTNSGREAWSLCNRSGL